VAPAGAARADREVVADRLAAAVGEDRRTAHPTCALLLVEGYDPPLDIEPFFSNFPLVMGSTTCAGRPKSFGALLRLAVFLDDFRAITVSRSLVLRSTFATLAFVARPAGLAKWHAQ
jgi:hypothetical protein